ncbi:MAG: GNAT family N-acetyltransferase [Paenibacillaceae bacterium]
MTHLIRLAQIDDYEGVSRLVAQIHHIHVAARPDIYAPYDTPMGIDYYRKILREERTAVIVAVNPDNGTIDAYTVIRIDEAAYRPIYKQRKYIFIDDFCVEENHRGQGIGKSLFLFLVEYAKEISASNIELGVAEFNTGALQFYESLGMKTRSRKMEYIIE